MIAVRRTGMFRIRMIGGHSLCGRRDKGGVWVRRLVQVCFTASIVGNEPPVSRVASRGKARGLSKLIVVGMYAVRRCFPACVRASTIGVSSFAEGRTEMKHRSHGTTQMKVRPHSKPECRTRRQSQRPGLSRPVLRAAQLAPAPVVAHL